MTANQTAVDHAPQRPRPVDPVDLATLYWERTKEIGKDQADALVAFAKASLDMESQRIGVVEQKGNWTIGTALTLTSIGTASVAWLGRYPEYAGAGIYPAIVALGAVIVGALVAFFGVVIEWDWKQPRPEAILDDVLRDDPDATTLRRRIAIHYLEVYESNVRQTQRRARYVECGQGWLIAGALLGVATALVLCISA